MSITSEINRIKGNIADAYTAADGKGATLPVTQDSANLASCISSITGGGITPTGTINITQNGVYDVTNYAEADVDVQGGSSPVIQSLSITPTTSQQTHTAPTGVDGYSPVTVSAVDSNIDPNIIAGNIKKDVTILGVTGTYEGGSTGWQCIPMYQIVNGTAYKTSAKSTVLHGDEFTGLVTVGNGVFSSAFENFPISGTVDLSSIQTVGGNSFYYTFAGTNISGTIDLSSLTSVGARGFSYAFKDCTAITSADFSSLTDIQNPQCFEYTFYRCWGLTTADFSSLVNIAGDSPFDHTFEYCSQELTSVDFSSLTSISGGVSNSVFESTFKDCEKLATFPFTALESISDWVFSRTFTGCLRLTTASFTALNSITQTANNKYPFWATFAECTNLTDVYFPALTSTSFGSYTTQFDYMLNGASNVTVHFPSNLQSVIGSWSGVQSGMGGTNTTVLFDLTATS